MTTRTIRTVWAAALVASGAIAAGAYAQSGTPTAIELAQMPKFCYGEFRVPGAEGDEYRIPRSTCGGGVNHYCYGLMKLIRAKGYVPNKQKRKAMLEDAAADFRYTASWIKDYPTCPIRDHVTASLSEVRGLQLGYGFKPSAGP